MRLGRHRKSRAGQRGESVKRPGKLSADAASGAAPDSIAGVAFEDRDAPSARDSLANRPRLRRVTLPIAAAVCAMALMPFEPHVKGRMGQVWAAAKQQLAAARSARVAHAAPPSSVSAASPAAAHAGPAPGDTPRFSPGRGSMAGGVFFLPDDLRVAADGSVDVLVHFHGNTEMVIESVRHAKLGAATVVINLGVGSGPYEDRFDNPESFMKLLTSVEGALARRGLQDGKIGRLALSAWSAGYGAVLRILKNERLAPGIDAVMLFDGMHVGYLPDGRKNWISIGPFEAFADRAVRGETLFVVTHSNIEPVDYLGVKETSDRLLLGLGMQREEAHCDTELLAFDSFVGVLPKAEMVPLRCASAARKGNFHVLGYRGNQPNTHIAHLMQMSQTGLPWLNHRWSTPAQHSFSQFDPR